MIENILYNTDNPDILKLEVAVESAELNVDRLLNTFTALETASELDLRDAELRCISESGDIEDLERYYVESKEKTEEKKEGLLKRIWEAIKKICRSIKEFFTGKKNTIDPNKTYKAPKGLISKLKAMFGVLKNIGSNIVKWMKQHWKGATFVAVGGILSVILAGKAGIFDKLFKGKPTENVKGVDIQELYDISNEYMNDIVEAIQTQIEVSNEMNNGGSADETSKEVASGIKTFLSHFKEGLSTIISFITKTGSSIKNKNEEEKPKNNKSEENGNKNASNDESTGDATKEKEAMQESAYDLDIDDELDSMFNESENNEDSIWDDDEFAESGDDSTNEISNLLDEILC